MGKGDTRRPSHVSKKEYDANFEAVFGRKELRQWEDAPQTGEGNRGTGGEVPPNKDDSRDVPTSSTPTEAEVSTIKEGDNSIFVPCELCGHLFGIHQTKCPLCHWERIK